MKKSADMELCDGCGQSDLLTEKHGNEFCPSCYKMAEVLTTRPDLVKKLDVLDAVRYRTRDREQNTWYVSVSEMEGDPVEIFASTAFDRDQHLQSRISNLTTITRLISLILRHVFLGEVLTLDKTLKQLRRSSRQKNDLPDMLSSVLSNYRGNEMEKSG
jgi:uncharacterized Zn finger protein (UPF0148 family)